MTRHDSLRLLEGLFIKEDDLQAELLDYARSYPLNVRGMIYDLIVDPDAQVRSRAVAAQFLASQLFRFWEKGFLDADTIQRVIEHNDKNEDKFWSLGATTRAAQMYRRLGTPNEGFLVGVQDNGIPEHWAAQDSVSSRIVRFRGGDLDGVEATLGELYQRKAKAIPRNHPVFTAAQIYVTHEVEPLEPESDEFDEFFSFSDSPAELALVMIPA